DGPVAVVAAAADPAAAEPLLPAAAVGVVLVHAAGGPAAVLRLARAAAAPPVVVLGVPDRDADVLAVLQAGAAGYVPDGATLAEAVEVIRAVAAGQTVCPPRVLAAVFRRVCELSAPGPADDRLAALSRRQREILALVGRELTNKQIARALGVTVCTVKNHVHRLLDKLGVGRRRAAARLATAAADPDRGLVPAWTVFESGGPLCGPPRGGYTGLSRAPAGGVPAGRPAAGTRGGTAT
ncbi:MAG TPA: response regulator transcription factor, partial [Gemmataceae bacterium]